MTDRAYAYLALGFITTSLVAGLTHDNRTAWLLAVCAFIMQTKRTIKIKRKEE